MEEAMIQAQVMAARVACARMTALNLNVLHDSVERACGADSKTCGTRRSI
jgi:hypothetical protein